MEISDLKVNLEAFLRNEDLLIAEIYFIIKGESNIYLKFADIDKVSQDDLTKAFISSVKSTILEDEEIDIVNISNSDDRLNVLYEYDLESIPSELEVIDEIIANEDIEPFSFDVDSLKNVNGILVLIENEGQNLVLYKKHYPVNLFRQDSKLFGLVKDGNRFTHLTDDLIKIYPSFEFFKFDNTLFIRDLKTLERFFGFHDIIKQKAESCIDVIESVDIVEDPSELRELTDDLTFARKLTKVGRSSPVLSDIPKENIISFADRHPALKGRFKFNEERTRFDLNSKKSMNLFVKLLNDDFLTSELTRIYYDSLAKDAVEKS